jgi:hypothetical protein
MLEAQTGGKPSPIPLLLRVAAELRALHAG